ncbi:hypothetical protein [Mobiluncus mulieris]|uniref:hypothetical protein n=1 Tax=Mobiluncus mulieris TaxID=2052 RepID=UPI0020922F21|nr:hypothetical protein [Mobiluncus mulieris]
MTETEQGSTLGNTVNPGQAPHESDFGTDPQPSRLTSARHAKKSPPPSTNWSTECAPRTKPKP